MHRLLAHVVAAPAEATPSRRVAPVARLGRESNLERLARRAARRLGHRDTRPPRRALVDRELRDGAFEHGYVTKICRLTNVVGIEPGVVEHRFLVGRVAICVANESAQKPATHRFELEETRALGAPQILQQLECRTAAQPFPCRVQNTAQHCAVEAYRRYAMLFDGRFMPQTAARRVIVSHRRSDLDRLLEQWPASSGIRAVMFRASARSFR